MTFALALLAGALLAGWVVPQALRHADLRRRDPLPLIVAWLVSVAGVLLAIATGVVLLLLPEHGSAASLLAVLHRCWSAVQHGSPPHVEEFAGFAGIALLAAFCLRLGVVSVRGFRARGQKRRASLAALKTVARPGAGPADVLWLAHSTPLAFSMTGRPGVVVVTEGLTRDLDQSAVAAVLAHERAHLRGRHHLVVAAAEAVRATLPFVPLCRQLPRAVRELVELAADVTAARDCGAAAVSAALTRVARQAGPADSLAMAQGAVDVRLARLRRDTRPPGAAGRAVLCVVSGFAAVVLPFAVGATVLIGIALATCPLG